MGKFITLREEFESETGAHPFADQQYIKWLEKVVEQQRVVKNCSISDVVEQDKSHRKDDLEEILDKHLELRSWTKTVPKNGNLYNTLIDALNEALSIASVVNRRELLLAFCQFMHSGTYDSHNTTHSQDIDAFLESQ